MEDLQREKDIQELCKQVLEDCYVEPDWSGITTCPFCYNKSSGEEMTDIDHKGNCAYLIAKDLRTNL